MDGSGFPAIGNNEVRIPNIADNFTTSSINTTSGDIGAKSISDTNTKLLINKWEGNALNFTRYQLDEVAGNYAIRKKYAQDLAYGVARKVDADIWNAAKTGLTTSLGDSATALTSTNLEMAFSILASNSVPRSELSIVLHPKMQFGDLFKRAKYFDASKFGKSVLPEGAYNQVMGVPVYLNENMGTSSGALSNFLVHREAVAFAVPKGVQIEELHGESLRVKVAAHSRYGYKILRSNGGIQLLAKNDR